MIESGGHTIGHIVYHLPDEALLFAGDTIFPMGCGRIFEGTPAQMWNSLSLIAALPRLSIPRICGGDHRPDQALDPWRRVAS